LSRIVDPSVAVDTPPEDAAAVELAVAVAVFFGSASMGITRTRKSNKERARIHDGLIKSIIKESN